MIALGTTKRRDKPTSGDIETAEGSRARKRTTQVVGDVPDSGNARKTAAPQLVMQQPVIRSIAGTVIEPISLLFDTDWYRSQYPDVAAAGLDPIRHFFDNGAREGRNPNAFFETSWYVSTNADVAASMMNPFLHYLLYGAREGRKAKP